MKLLIVADEECPGLWDYYRPGKLDDYQLILSSGDLKSEYLSFLVTMAHCPVLYVHGNHDGNYEKFPPEGCDCVDDKLMVYKGLRILGLGGCCRYREGDHQYTQKQMAKRIRKLKKAIQLAGGVDIVLTHAAPKGVGDADDHSHQGFEAFLQLIEQYHPQYLLHGHVHLSYSHGICREREYKGTQVINCCERYDLDAEPRAPFSPLSFWKRLYARLFVQNLEIVSDESLYEQLRKKR